MEKSPQNWRTHLRGRKGVAATLVTLILLLSLGVTAVMAQSGSTGDETPTPDTTETRPFFNRMLDQFPGRLGHRGVIQKMDHASGRMGPGGKMGRPNMGGLRGQTMTGTVVSVDEASLTLEVMPFRAMDGDFSERFGERMGEALGQRFDRFRERIAPDATENATGTDSDGEAAEVITAEPIQVVVSLTDTTRFFAADLALITWADLAAGDTVSVAGDAVWGTPQARFVYAAAPDALRDLITVGRLVADNGESLTVAARDGSEFTVRVSDETVWLSGGVEGRPDAIPDGLALRILGSVDDDGTVTAAVIMGMGRAGK